MGVNAVPPQAGLEEFHKKKFPFSHLLTVPNEVRARSAGQ